MTGNNVTYLYHGDVWRTSDPFWITDASGVPVQYLPFGEPLVNQHTSGYEERFTFTGKERDEETGYGYFGARYMDHELMTMWLSVDPMADKYPGISPYAYCAWNPVKLVDPDGREVGNYYTEDGILLGTDNIADGKVYIVPSEKVQEKVKNGDFNLNENERYELPSYNARNAMCDFLEKSDQDDNLREYGGQIWEEDNNQNNQTIRRALPGARWDGVSYASCDPTDDGNAGFDFVGKNLLTNFHSHFSGMIGDRGLEQIPSDANNGLHHEFDKGDIQNVMRNGRRIGGARLPYNIMVAMRDRQVFLYTESGVKCKMSIETFRTVK